MEYCPRCGTTRNVRVSVSRRKLTDLKGNIKVLTKSYHCENCGSFVRSEEITNREKNPDDLIGLSYLNTKV